MPGSETLNKISENNPLTIPSIDNTIISDPDNPTSPRSEVCSRRGSVSSLVGEDDEYEYAANLSRRSSINHFETILEDIVFDENDKEIQDVYTTVNELTSDTSAARLELYQRYLHKPDTWANGLDKYLTKVPIPYPSAGGVKHRLGMVPVDTKIRKGSTQSRPGNVNRTGTPSLYKRPEAPIGFKRSTTPSVNDYSATLARRRQLQSKQINRRSQSSFGQY